MAHINQDKSGIKKKTLTFAKPNKQQVQDKKGHITPYNSAPKRIASRLGDQHLPIHTTLLQRHGANCK